MTRPEIGRSGRHGMGWQDKIAALDSDSGGGAKMQYGALCWRLADAGTQVLLITSRDTRRWIIPKGWPMPGLSPEASAEQEAWEEAGVEGDISPLCLGRYGYHKQLSVKASVPCAVVVYGLRVERLADNFPEVNERERKWFSLPDAASLVDEPALARIIASFTPPVPGRFAPISGAGANHDQAQQPSRAKGAGRKTH
jgi:8-oxo-dGTP pyrophosphatase MutT (NUDIX family)